MWLSSVNISLSLWKIVQCRKGALALFGSPLLEMMWKDGPFFYFVSFLRQSSGLRKCRSDVFCFHVRSRKPCFDDHSAHVLIRYTGLGFINIALLLLESVRNVFTSFARMLEFSCASLASSNTMERKPVRVFHFQVTYQHCC